MNKNKIFIPVFIAFSLIIGLYLGLFFGMRGASDAISFVMPQTSNTGKLGQILTFIDKQYVDTVEKDKLIDKAIESLLSDLDPHSYYISSEESQAYADPLEGKFEGIGVEFLLKNDTVVVINTIEKGPSYKVGIKAGDRIVNVDSIPFAGTNLNNRKIIATLRGESESKVRLEIFRPSDKSTKEFIVTRGSIPIKSIDAAYMINDTTAYLKVSRFAKTTYEEFNDNLKQLIKENRKLSTLILDLKNNGGGYLTAAIDMCDALLPKGDLIVYTKGKSRPEKRYYSEKDGAFAHLSTKVIINESSASASEILAGAIQDNDAGLIIGRRSFGKGLVQEHIELRDLSALRLTVARYYTPSGRCIQKPYGDTINYSSDVEKRVKSGELYYRDSIRHIDTLIYKTKNGRTVYGGGGIIPDVFVALDTTQYSSLLDALLYSGTLNQFAFSYVDKQRSALKSKFKTKESFFENFKTDKTFIKELLTYAGIDDYKVYERLNDDMKRAIATRSKAFIARDIFGIAAYYEIINSNDTDIEAAVKA